MNDNKELIKAIQGITAVLGWISFWLALDFFF